MIGRAKEEASKGDKLAQYCAHKFGKVSPFALKLTFEILKRTQFMSYDLEKELELKVMRKILDPKIGDLYEGITALLI